MGKSSSIVHSPSNLCYLRSISSDSHICSCSCCCCFWVSFAHILSALRSSTSNHLHVAQARQTQNDQCRSFPEFSHQHRFLGLEVSVSRQSQIDLWWPTADIWWHTRIPRVLLKLPLVDLWSVAPLGSQVKDGDPLLGFPRPESLGQNFLQ